MIPIRTPEKLILDNCSGLGKMDKRKQIKQPTIYHLPADQVKNVKALFFQILDFNYICESGKVLPGEIQRRYKAVTGEMHRLNAAGVSMGLMVCMDFFAQYPRPREADNAPPWPAFLSYLEHSHGQIKVLVTHDTGHGVEHRLDLSGKS